MSTPLLLCLAILAGVPASFVLLFSGETALVGGALLFIMLFSG